MIELVDVALHAGSFHLEGVSFHVPAGAYAVLMGKSGTGKTTLLEGLIGLRAVSHGQIRLDGRDVTHLKPAVRGIGYVPQDGALFSTMTVREQMALGLIIRKVPTRTAYRRVEALAEHLAIDHLLPRRPRGLSGGERQRVALGRALAFEPPVLCLDEPLSALDDDTRSELIDLLKRVQQETGVTVVHVTHHRSEAERLADFRLELIDGKVVTTANGEPPGGQRRRMQNEEQGTQNEEGSRE